METAYLSDEEYAAQIQAAYRELSLLSLSLATKAARMALAVPEGDDPAAVALDWSDDNPSGPAPAHGIAAGATRGFCSLLASVSKSIWVHTTVERLRGGQGVALPGAIAPQRRSPDPGRHSAGGIPAPPSALPLAGLTAMVSSIGTDLDSVSPGAGLSRHENTPVGDDPVLGEAVETAWDTEIDREINRFLAKDYPELLADKPDPDDLGKVLSRMMGRHHQPVPDTGRLGAAKTDANAETEP